MKRIALLATGGTIACRATKDGLMPALDAAGLLEGVSVRQDVMIDCQDVFRMDSSNIQPEEWTRLAKAVHKAAQDHDGIVVTHGTDTMGYTASALSYMLLGIHCPVVLTGSQLPLGAPLSDAELNLSCAIESACFARPGVFVCFDRKLIWGTRAVKTHTTSFNAFDSINSGLAGYFDSEGIHLSADNVPEASEYCFRPEVDNRVFLLKLYPGTQPDILDFVQQAGYRGLVIEAFGLGGIHYIRRNLIDKLQMLRQKGIRILVVTQCMFEKADLSIYEVGTRMLQSDVISGMDMTTEAAITKMMWALAQDNTDQLLRISVCREMK